MVDSCMIFQSYIFASSLVEVRGVEPLSKQCFKKLSTIKICSEDGIRTHGLLVMSQARTATPLHLHGQDSFN